MRSLRFSVRGQLLFIRGGHLRLPLQHPSGEGRHGTILHCLPGPDHQIEKAAGDLAFAQLFLNAQIAPLAMVGGMAAAGGVLAGAEMRHGSSPFAIKQGPPAARRLNRAWVTWAAISEARRQFSSKQAAADRFGRIGDGANGEEWDAVCMADMGNGRGFHIRAKGVKCGPHGLCPRAREKGFSGHHPPKRTGRPESWAAWVAKESRKGSPGNQMESIQGWNSVRISSATS